MVIIIHTLIIQIYLKRLNRMAVKQMLNRYNRLIDYHLIQYSKYLMNLNFIHHQLRKQVIKLNYEHI